MLTDEQLARKMSEGDQEAFEMLVNRFHGPLLLYAARLVGDREKAKDLVQETFIKLIRHLREQDGLDHVKAWLYRVLMNLCRDYWKSAAAVRERAAGEQMPDKEDPHVNAEEQYLKGETADEIRMLLGELTMMQQQVITLRFYEDMKLQDIAELLNIPLSTAKSSLYAGLRRLKVKILEKPELYASMPNLMTDTFTENEVYAHESKS